MGGGVFSMSGAERERAHLVRHAIEGHLSQREASQRLGIGVGQFKRLVRNWRACGDAGLVSRQRGRPSHRRMADDLRARICALLKEKYADFGATLAAEKLEELDQIQCFRRDGAAAADRSWPVATEEAACETGVPTAPAPPTVGRTAPDRRQSA